jgi:hypothetical protein
MYVRSSIGGSKLYTVLEYDVVLSGINLPTFVSAPLPLPLYQYHFYTVGLFFCFEGLENKFLRNVRKFISCVKSQKRLAVRYFNYSKYIH